MPYGFTDDKEKADMTAAINAGLAPVINQINILQQQLQNYWKTVYPIGSIFTTTTQTNPANVFGGKWEMFGNGRCLVGFDPFQTEFNQVGKTGGTKLQHIPIDYRHNHGVMLHSSSPYIYENYEYNPQGQQRNNVLAANPNGDGSQGTLQYIPVNAVLNPIETDFKGSQGSNTAEVNKLQPYVVVYFWRRTS